MHKTIDNIQTRKLFSPAKKVRRINTRELLERSQQLFDSELVSPDINQANREKWIRSIMILGDRWELS